LQHEHFFEVRDLIFLRGLGDLGGLGCAGVPTQSLHLLTTLSSVLGFLLNRLNGFLIPQIEHFLEVGFFVFMFPIYERGAWIFLKLRFFWLRFFAESLEKWGWGVERVF